MRSVLVLVPHPDDEVLAAGGVLQQHLRRGDRVTVVFLTCGDGQRSRPLLPHRHFLHVGLLRQQEALAALERLGLGAAHARFLGYPDRGLIHLWATHWTPERPYRSRYTGVDHVPYPAAQTPGAPYCGQALVEDLVRLLEAERPDLLYLPHPNDEHTDHSAAYVFGAYAQELGRLERRLKPAEVRCFLLHRGQWPLSTGPQKARFLRLAPALLHGQAQACTTDANTIPRLLALSERALEPPPALARLDTRWHSVPLSPSERAHKYRALLAYRSQLYWPLRRGHARVPALASRPAKRGGVLALHGLRMLSFVCRNELFGEVPVLQLNGHAAWPAQLAWGEAVPASVSWPAPKRRSLLASLRRLSDVSGVELRREGAHLHVEIRFFNRFYAEDDLRLRVVPVGAGEPLCLEVPGRPRRQPRHSRRSSSASLEPALAPRRKAVRFAIADEEIGSPSFLVGVEVLRQGRVVGRSAYRLVRGA